MRESLYSTDNKAHSADTEADNPWGLVPDSFRPWSTSPPVPARPSALTSPAFAAFHSSAVTVPAGSHVHLLLDRKTLTTAYPRLTVSGGKGAQITLTYAEALYDKDQHKGDRDEVDDRAALGLTDSFLPDGGAHRVF